MVGDLYDRRSAVRIGRYGVQDMIYEITVTRLIEGPLDISQLDVCATMLSVRLIGVLLPTAGN